MSIRIERRWPLWCLLAVAVLWLAAAGYGVLKATPPGPDAPHIAAVLVAILPPLALALVAAALLPAAGQSLALAEAEDRLVVARDMVGDLQQRLAQTDAGLAATVDHTRALAEAASSSLPGLGGSAAALEAAAVRIADNSVTTQRLVDGFGTALPMLARTIAEVDSTLRSVSTDSAAQLRAVEATLASVQSRSAKAAADADAAIAEMTALLAKIDEASARNTSALSKRAYALDAAVDGVLERTTAAVDHMREQVEGQLRGLESGVDAAGRHLTLLGDDSARLFNQRVELLLATSTALKGHLAEHGEASARLHALLADHVDAAQARLVAFGDAGGATVDALAERIDAAHDRAMALTDPIASTQAAITGLENAADLLGQKVLDVDDVLGERLAGTRQSIAAFETEAQRLFETVAGLRTAIGDGSGAIGDAAGALAAERAEIARIGEILAEQFDAARTALAELESGSAAAAASIESGLGAEVARLAVAGEAAAAGIRSALAGVVDEALAGLEAAAAGGAEAVFGAPVREQISAIEAASARAATTGQDAATRLAGHMLRLVETVDTVENRVREVETRFAVRDRDSLTKRSAGLIRQLQAATVDVARLMSIRVGDVEAGYFLKGDRSVYARAIAGQIDRDTVGRIKRLLADDREFQADATRFCETFEALLSRLLGDQDGDALAMMMLSSDLGKIYVGIAEAAGRKPPTG